MALRGKVAIITGASSGIGAAIAERFSREGASVSITGRKEDNLQAVANKCRTNSDHVLTTVGDIRNLNTRQTLVQRTKDQFNKIDILVNNAGLVHFSPVTQESEHLYDEQMDVNLKVPVFLTALAVPHLTASKGSVLNISSIARKRVVDLSGVYSVTKAGLEMYTKVLAKELAPEGVRVNSVAPGFIGETQILENSGFKFDADSIKEIADSSLKAVPLGRNGTLKDVADTAVFLASDKASFITGQILILDGGRTL